MINMSEKDRKNESSICPRCGGSDFHEVIVEDSEKHEVRCVKCGFIYSGRDRNYPVVFPAAFVEYWIGKPRPYIGEQTWCDYCSEPIKKGENVFYTFETNKQSKKLGHVSHLKSAPPREWMFDPSKRVLQPWETDPTIEAPSGWEEWRRRHRS